MSQSLLSQSCNFAMLHTLTRTDYHLQKGTRSKIIRSVPSSAVEWGEKWAASEIYHLNSFKSNFLGNWNMRNYRTKREVHKLSNFQFIKELCCKEVFESWLLGTLLVSKWFGEAHKSSSKPQSGHISKVSSNTYPPYTGVLLSNSLLDCRITEKKHLSTY